MLGFLFGRKSPFVPPERWQELPAGDESLRINRALEDWEERFDFGVLCRVTQPRPGRDPDIVEDRLRALGAGRGRAVLAVVKTTPREVTYLAYAASLHEAGALRKALLAEHPAIAFTVERDNFWQVYRELLPL